jgi:hypothetical protein
MQVKHRSVQLRAFSVIAGSREDSEGRPSREMVRKKLNAENRTQTASSGIRNIHVDGEERR